MNTKQCSLCRRELPLCAFGTCSRNKSGKRAECKQCRQEHERTERIANRKRNKVRDTSQFKRCGKCGQTLQVNEFDVDRNRKDGCHAICKTCRRQYQNTAYQTPQRQLSHRVAAAKMRAKKSGVPFAITTAYVYDLWVQQSGLCAVSGLPMVCDGGSENTTSNAMPFRPSIDRIRPQDGYVPGNIRLTATIVNMALGDWGLKPFLRMCHAVVSK